MYGFQLIERICQLASNHRLSMFFIGSDYRNPDRLPIILGCTYIRVFHIDIHKSALYKGGCSLFQFISHIIQGISQLMHLTGSERGRFAMHFIPVKALMQP